MSTIRLLCRSFSSRENDFLVVTYDVALRSAAEYYYNELIIGHTKDVKRANTSPVSSSETTVAVGISKSHTTSALNVRFPLRLAVFHVFLLCVSPSALL